MTAQYYILDLFNNYVSFGLSKARAYQLVKEGFMNCKDIYIHRKHGFTHLELFNNLVQIKNK